MRFTLSIILLFLPLSFCRGADERYPLNDGIGESRPTWWRHSFHAPVIIVRGTLEQTEKDRPDLTISGTYDAWSKLTAPSLANKPTENNFYVLLTRLKVKEVLYIDPTLMHFNANISWLAKKKKTEFDCMLPAKLNQIGKADNKGRYTFTYKLSLPGGQHIEGGKEAILILQYTRLYPLSELHLTSFTGLDNLEQVRKISDYRRKHQQKPVPLQALEGGGAKLKVSDEIFTEDQAAIAKSMDPMRAIGQDTEWYRFHDGTKDAEEDIARGDPRIKRYGLTIGGEEAEAIAKVYLDRLGIKIEKIAGCMVTKELAEYADAYNKRIDQYVLKKYGSDAWSIVAPDAAPLLKAITTKRAQRKRQMEEARKANDKTKKPYLIPPDQLKQLISDRKEGVAADTIMIDGQQIGYMTRVKPVNGEDSGWRFHAHGESDQYMDDPWNTGFIKMNTICNYSEDIIPLLNAPVGSTYIRNLSTNKMEAANTLPMATKDRPYKNSLGMRFAPVPISGGPNSGQTVFFSIWETKYQDYLKFIREDIEREWTITPFKQEKNSPAVRLNWQDAEAFCIWLTKRERAKKNIGMDKVYRLPTDHEWSCAVGIGRNENAEASPRSKNGKLASVYSWGSHYPPKNGAGNFYGENSKPSKQLRIKGYNDRNKWTAVVGSFEMNEFGLYDMGGNVWEWCQDYYDPKEKDQRLLRGACWNNSREADLLASKRLKSSPDVRNNAFGFRVVIANVAEVSTSEQ